MSGAQAALAYVLGHSEISCAVVGSTRMAHLADDLAASGMRLSAELAVKISDAQQGR
jgi:aryl-alcohol dehydrogenase-like predicted oxidoreductase